MNIMSKGSMSKVGFNTKKGSDSDKNYDEESGLFSRDEYGNADDREDAVTSCLAGAVLSSSLRHTLDILC